VAVSRDLLLRLEMKVGDHVEIGGQDFTIIGVVESEPDRMSGSLNVGPRVMMTRAGLDRTGLLIPGSRASERFLFRIPSTVSIERIHAELKGVFPDSLVTDFRQSNPTIERGLERATTFLSLVSLIALIVGALGVAMAIESHLQQKLDSIAVIKCLGGRSSQIIHIYTLQTLGLGLIGGLIGIIFGIGVQAAFPFLLARYFHLTPVFFMDPVSAFQGLGIGLLATLLFTLPPLLSIRRVRPVVIFRRDVTVDDRRWLDRAKANIPSLIAGAVILLGIGGIAAWLAGSPSVGAYFAGALVVSLAAMWAVGWALLRGLKWFGRRVAWRVRPSFRHGIANLYRPGAHTQAALTALGIGVMFTLTVYLLQRGMLSEMMRSAPPGMPNVFLLDMTPQSRDHVMQLVSAQKGIEQPPESIGTVAARITAINGSPLVRQDLKGAERRFGSSVSLTTTARFENYTKLLSGAWWDPERYSPEAEVSVGEDAARILHLAPGDVIDWITPNRTFRSRVVAIHRTESIRLTSRIEFVFSPGSLAGLPMVYYGTVRVKPELVPELQQQIYRKFPTITVVNVADVMAIVQDVVNQISMVVRFISAFAMIAGAIILASSIAGTRFRRIQEVVILKTLGATRRRIAEIFSIEFCILGIVAGVAGSLMATGFASLLLARLLKSEAHVDVIPNAAAIVLTAAIALAAGWLASFRILSQRPLEVLRGE
jgi:putative ABC transport system permease protein